MRCVMKSMENNMQSNDMQCAFKQGNMFNELNNLTENDLILVTTNSYIDAYGRLVMGRGAAKEIRFYHPKAPVHFGQLIMEGGVGHLGKYGILLHNENKYWIGAFQTKYHFRDDSQTSLIAHSINLLNKYAVHFTRILVNYPGIGNGRLTKEQVEPLLTFMPRNVEVWEHEYKNKEKDIA